MKKCFANKGNYCSALKPKKCKGCNFFKTEKQFQDGKDKAQKRIDSLDDTAKYGIYDKYFKGERL